MNKDVVVKVKGVQGPAGSEEAIETITPGLYYKKSGKRFIKYEDGALDQEHLTPTTIKIEESRITVIRYGPTNTQMVFEEGRVHAMPYETAFGVFDIVTETKGITIEETDTKLVVIVDYTIDVSDSGPIGSQLFMEVTQQQ